MCTFFGKSPTINKNRMFFCLIRFWPWYLLSQILMGDLDILTGSMLYYVPPLVQTCLHATVCWNLLCWSTTSQSPLLTNLAKVCIILRFFCGKEPSIGGAKRRFWACTSGDDVLCNFSQFSGFFFQFFRNFCLFTWMTIFFQQWT